MLCAADQTPPPGLELVNKFIVQNLVPKILVAKQSSALRQGRGKERPSESEKGDASQ